MITIEKVVVGSLEVNCYVASCEKTRNAVIIDPGDNINEIISVVDLGNYNVKYILNTHAHADHVGANGRAREKYGAPILIHKADSDFLVSPINGDMAAFYGVAASPEADRFISDGEIIEVCCDFSIKVIHTPGHTSGGVCYQIGNDVFSGDTLFANSIGRWDLPPGGNHKQLIESIRQKLIVLPPETVVHPGHGEDTTIGGEIEYNPYIRGM